MKAPHPLSVVLVLASATVLAASRSRGRDRVVIDRSFLGELLTRRFDAPSESDDERIAGTLIWGHWNALVYLTGEGDPDANFVVARVLAADRVPGGCSCSLGRLAAVMFNDGLPPSFLAAVGRLDPTDQVRVVRRLDALVESGTVSGEDFDWDEVKSEFLAGRPAVEQGYRALVAGDQGPTS